MTASRSKPPFPFDQVKKFGWEDHLDIPATLGRIVETTYKQYPSETLQPPARLNILGTLRVDLSARLYQQRQHYNWRIFIESDNPRDEIRLLWLQPWFNQQIENERCATISVDLISFDRHFILPWLKEFKAHLHGQHPLEFLILEDFRAFLAAEDCPFKSSPYEIPACILDDATGEVIVTLTDGKQLRGIEALESRLTEMSEYTELHRLASNHLRTLENLQAVKQLQLKLQLAADKFIEASMADVAIECDDLPLNGDRGVWSAVKTAAQTYPNVYALYLLISVYQKYQKDFLYASFFEETRQQVVAEIIKVISAMPSAEVSPFFYYLISLHDEDILTALSRKMAERFVVENPMPDSAIWQASSSIERRKWAACLFDAGVTLPEQKNANIQSDFYEELEKTWQQRHPIHKPLIAADCSVADNEFKPLISFASAATLTTENQLDVAATLGEMIKQAFNQNSDLSDQIKGNLRVVWKDEIEICSDQADESLEKLLSWLGEVDKEYGWDWGRSIIHLIDWYFICPYLDDFKKYLGNVHPFQSIMGDALIFKHWQEEKDFFLGHDKLENAYEAYACQQLRSESRRVEDELQYQLGFLDWLESHYSTICVRLSYSKSLTDDFKKAFANYITHSILPTLRLNEFSALQLIGLLRCIPDKTIYSMVLPYLRALQTDIGVLPLEWFGKTWHGKPVSSILLPQEKQWLLGRLLDAGASVCSEAVSLARDADVILLTIHPSEYYRADFAFICQYFNMLASDIHTVLTRDTTGIVMRYIVGDDFKNYLHSSAAATLLSQNSHTLFAAHNKNVVRAQPGVLPGINPGLRPGYAS